MLSKALMKLEFQINRKFPTICWPLVQSTQLILV